MWRTDQEMQEFIDTRGFFVRHGRHRRAALFPVAPSPEVDVAADSVSRDVTRQHHRQRRDTDDDKVRRDEQKVKDKKKLKLENR